MESLTLQVIKAVRDRLEPSGTFTESECHVIAKVLTIIIEEIEREHGSILTKSSKVSTPDGEVSGH